MARKPFSLSKPQLSELSREVKNYNARIAAFKKKYPTAYTPEKVFLKEVKPLITSKRQYNKLLGDLRFATAKNLRPGPKGLSNYQKRINRREKARVQPSPQISLEQHRKEILKDFVAERSAGRFPTDREFIAREIGLRTDDIGNYERLVEWMVDKKDRSIMWQENYMKAIDKAMEMAVLAGNVEAQESLYKLMELIKSMQNTDFLIGQLIYGELLGIDYIYPVRGEEFNSMAERVNRIISDWNKVI